MFTCAHVHMNKALKYTHCIRGLNHGKNWLLHQKIETGKLRGAKEHQENKFQCKN